MKIPRSLAGRFFVLLSILAAMIAIAVGGAYALGLGPWADGAVGGGERNETPFTPEDPDDGPVIATADGTPIYLTEARSRIEGLASMHGDVEESLGSDWHEIVLQSLVDDAIIQAEADRRAIVVTEAEIDESLDRLRGMFETDEAFETWVREQGITVLDLERRVWLQTLAARVYLAVTDDVAVSGQELREYYRTHRDEYEEADGFTPPFISVRVSLRETLLKERQDEAYAAWLAEAREGIDLVVLEEEWWRDL